ncbi:MAG: hypothetical protein V1702_05205 [Candidatus Woesearchaeota archaeon]
MIEKFGNLLARKKLAVFAVLAVVFLLLLVFFTRNIINILVVILLMVLGSFSTYYKRRLGVPLGGFELVTFGTVVTGILYGPVVGGLFGAISLTASSVLSADISPMTLLGVLATGLGGVIAGLLNGSVFFIGMLVTAEILILSQSVSFVIGDGEIKATAVIYIVTNMLTNIALFATLGPLVVSWLA